MDIKELVERARDEVRDRPEIKAQVVIDQVVSEALAPLDIKSCMSVLIMGGSLPCAQEVNRIVPCSTFLSPTYKEGIRAAAWVMLTTLIEESIQ